MLKLVSTIDDDLRRKLPVFASKEFLSAKSSEFGWFQSDQFVLPFIVDHRGGKLGFRRLIFTTETISLVEEPTVNSEQNFLNEVLQFCKHDSTVRADWVTVQANAVFRTTPSESEELPWGSYVVDLRRTEEEIFNSFDSAHKNRIRRAARAGVVVEQTEDVDLIYQNLKETMARQNSLFYPSRDYLGRLKRQLENCAMFYVARLEGKVQGTAVIVRNDLGAFYYYGGSAKEPFPGSLVLLQHEAIKTLKSLQTPVYDLMGARLIVDTDSKIEGIQRFKRRFASGMRRGYYFRQIVSPIRTKVFQFAVKTYFFAKGSKYEGDAIDQTRHSKQKQAQVAAERVESVQRS